MIKESLFIKFEFRMYTIKYLNYKNNFIKIIFILQTHYCEHPKFKFYKKTFNYFNYQISLYLINILLLNSTIGYPQIETLGYTYKLIRHRLITYYLIIGWYLTHLGNTLFSRDNILPRWVLHSPFSIYHHFWGETCYNIIYAIQSSMCLCVFLCCIMSWTWLG